MGEVLPKGWVETQLGIISVIVTGNTPSKSQPEFYGKDILWVKPGDFHGQKNIIDTQEKLSYLGFTKARKVPKNSILVTCIGNLGNIAIATEDLATNQQINSIVINNDNIHQKYIYYYSLTLKKWLVENSTSTTISMVNKSIFETAPVKLAPLAEQERIVVKLDALFGKIEKIKYRIGKITELNSSFFDSIFYTNLGLTNLSQFLIEQKARVGNDWFEYPKIGVSRKNGIIDLATGIKETFENYKIVRPGDLIYNTMRVNIGSIAVYEGKTNAITSPDYVVFSVNGISKYLLLNYLKSNIGLTNISSVTKGSVRSRLYFKNLITISFPILTESQHEIAEKVLFWFNTNIKRLYDLADVAFDKLLKTILTRAFKGQLVEQLPTDGDAKELLDEILKLRKVK